jgi:hypothetical protein
MLDVSAKNLKASTECRNRGTYSRFWYIAGDTPPQFLFLQKPPAKPTSQGGQKIRRGVLAGLTGPLSDEIAQHRDRFGEYVAGPLNDSTTKLELSTGTDNTRQKRLQQGTVNEFFTRFHEQHLDDERALLHVQSLTRFEAQKDTVEIDFVAEKGQGVSLD